MATERLGQQWHHTSLLAAVIANCHRNPRRRAFEPSDFHPMAVAKRKRNVTKAPITVLRDIFVDRRLPDLLREG